MFLPFYCIVASALAVPFLCRCCSISNLVDFVLKMFDKEVDSVDGLVVSIYRFWFDFSYLSVLQIMIC